MHSTLVTVAAVAITAGCAAKQSPGGSSDDCGHTEIVGPETQGVLGGHYSSFVHYASTWIETPVYKVLDGSLPAGLALDEQTGKIEGVPTEYGTWSITFGVRDANRGVCPEGRDSGLYYSVRTQLKIYTSLTE